MAKRRPLPFDPVQEAARQWESHFGADAAVEPMRAVTSLMRVQQIVLGRLDEILRRYDLTFARYEALVLLTFTRSGALPLGKMGERLQVHPTSVTSIVRRLERDGLVRRTPHPEDGRGVLAEVTDEGRAVVEATTKELVAIRFGFSALDDAALTTVHALLTEIRRDAGDFLT
ncbi:MarR family winged helix-turn-helix transcriptional regulator [Actinopolymorpha alba]|uniref:MarR family winged helix-turn-helix transcriptional regulator n=1 Tax=Actinopolymorpha alba TaxID=533267 RepID=UPI000477234A|nr:MarR family transcriptional regulator [Actinopolymorpha alba]